MRVRLVAVVLAAAGVAVPLPAAAKGPARAFDFNGDGRADKAVSRPDATVGGVENAGTVTVTYARGKAGRQVLSRASKGVPGVPSGVNGFGGSLASADFDRDGFADLAVSSPPEYGGSEDTVIIYGGRKGLTSRVARLSAAGDLRTADFARDGRRDLVVFGASSYTVYLDPRARPKKSLVQEFPSSRLGDFAADVRLHIADFTGDRRPDLALVADTPEGLGPFNPVLLRTGTRKGLGPLRTLAPAVNPSAVRDVDGDARRDLVATRPKADPPDGPPSGELLIFRGTPKGLTPPTTTPGTLP